MTDQDALAIKTLEVVTMHQNACAPITTYDCKCRTCGTRWIAIEVYDDHGSAPSAWSWQLDTSPAT